LTIIHPESHFFTSDLRDRASCGEQILDSKDLTQEEKNKRIKALQETFFGKEPEAFRRREAIYGRTGK
jgi:hypothetical protein